MTINAQTSDRLLTEVERQQKYLDKLPDDLAFRWNRAPPDAEILTTI